MTCVARKHLFVMLFRDFYTVGKTRVSGLWRPFSMKSCCCCEVKTKGEAVLSEMAVPGQKLIMALIEAWLSRLFLEITKDCYLSRMQRQSNGQMQGADSLALRILLILWQMLLIRPMSKLVCMTKSRPALPVCTITSAVVLLPAVA